MRTFIAIDLSKPLKKSISLLCARLDNRDVHVRWVKLEGMHLTLKFLGEISEEKRADVEEAMYATTMEINPFPLRLKGIGTFPPGQKPPRVLWVGVEENKILKNLDSRLEEELEKRGFSREKRPFHPHLTLARIKPGAHLGFTLEGLKKDRESDFGEMEVDRIALFLSTLKSTGAQYSVLSEFRLE